MLSKNNLDITNPETFDDILNGIISKTKANTIPFHKAFEFNVTSEPIHKPIELVYDRNYTKEYLDGQYQISLKLREKIVAQNDVGIAFSISDSSSPITNLKPLMAAGSHSVIVSSDLKEFLYVHPTEEVSSSYMPIYFWDGH